MKQIDVIRSLLMQGKSLTPMDALNNFGCFRLAARIKELREEGLKIETLKEQKNGKSYAKYRLQNCQLELFE